MVSATIKNFFGFTTLKTILSSVSHTANLVSFFSLIKGKDDIEENLNKIDTIIYTSGLGGLFKPGIPIGKIYKNSENKVDFFSDFTQLNYIKITSYNIEGKN